MSTRLKPGRSRYAVSFVLIVCGILMALGPALWIFAHRPRAVQFRVPGTKEIEVLESGTYTLWNDYETVFEGRTYSTSSNSLPNGLEIRLLKKDTGKIQEMRPSFGTTVSDETTSSRSVGEFSLAEPGKYELSVTGPAPAPLVFSFGRDWMFKFFGSLLLFGLIGAIIAIGGAIVGFITLLKRHKP